MPHGAQGDERALIERYRMGDEDALRALFDIHGGALQRWLRGRLPGRLSRRISVADLLQEVQIVAYRKRQDFAPDGPGSFRTWLIGIAERKTREAVRHHERAAKRAAGREVTRGERPATAQVAGHHATPSQHAIAQETAERARRVLASLAPDDREVLRLAREQQLPLREVAEQMGRSYAAARKLYARALVRFRRAFEDLESDP
jgi:RNA polymerase sigma-70 factor (subfamily 1)